MVTRATRNQTDEYEFTFANVCAQVARETNCLPRTRVDIQSIVNVDPTMRVNRKNNDIITCSSVLNHLRSKRVCVFYSLLFLALLEVCINIYFSARVERECIHRAKRDAFFARAMVASALSAADSARF